MRATRICPLVAILILFSILPIFILYFYLPISKFEIPKNVSNVTIVKKVNFNSLSRDGCKITVEEEFVFPNCLPKIKWLMEHWKEHICFSENGVDGSYCSARSYLSQYEHHCPTITGDSSFDKFQPNTNLDDLFNKLKDYPPNYEFIKTRITKLWQSWIKAVEEIRQRYPKQFDNYKRLNIIVHLGFLMKESKLNFASKSTTGGPLGELVQWSDLIAALHILGHNLFITTDKQALLENIQHFSSDPPCPGEGHLNLIVTDIIGFLRVFRRQKSFASQNSCKFRFVDSFGTHAEFNNKQYFLKNKKTIGGSLKNPWGGHDLHLQQYWTFYPHTTDNFFLGFVVEKDDEMPLYPRESKKSVLIYGKEQYMWANISDVITSLEETHEIHATVADAGKDNPVFEKVVNHGFLNQSQLSSLLKSVEIFVGLGFPLEGPAPLEAIAAGAAFINHKFDPPQYRGNTQFLSEKPTLRKWTSQVPYLENLGAPYVYTVNIHDKSELQKALQRISKQKRDPFIPLDFRPLGMLLRVNQILLNYDLCVPFPTYPPRKELLLKYDKGSCDHVCSSASLICDPSFFPYANTKDALLTFTTCEYISYEDSTIAPYGCTLQKSVNLFSCASIPSKGISRLCPCRMSTASQSPNRLHYLCCSRSPHVLELIRSLLAKGANPKERGADGLTPLHAAAAFDNIAICQLLLHFGADIYAKDDLGRTPIILAIGNSKQFLTRHAEQDRRTRRGVLRRIFACQIGIYPLQSQPSFIRSFKNQVRRSLSAIKWKKSDNDTSTVTALEFEIIPEPKTPRRRARTPEVLERTPRTISKTPKRSKTPDFDPGTRKNQAICKPPTPKTSSLVIMPRRNGNKLPPRNMTTPSAPPLTPKTPRKNTSKSSPTKKITPIKPQVADISTASEYVTAEESLNTEELEERLSQLQIKTIEPVFVDKDNLQRIKKLKENELKVELRKLGIAFGPICSRTRHLYEKKLLAAMEQNKQYVVLQGTVKYSRQLELAFSGKFDSALGRKLDEAIKAAFSNSGVTAFVYLLLDPRILGSETHPTLKLFVESIFYIGKGTKARPLAHLIDAKRLKQEKNPKLETMEKFSKINSIWNSGQGVGLLEISHTISDQEAFTREAAFIEAIGRENLSNIKNGEWHGISKRWDMISRATFGVHLIEQARIILHTLSIRRVFPEDLPDSVYPFVTTRRR